MNENIGNFSRHFKLISIIGQVLYFSRQTIEHFNPKTVCSLLIC